MSISPAGVSWASAVLAVVLLALPVRAEPPDGSLPEEKARAGGPAEGAAARRKEAEQRYGEGARAYRDGRYKDAIDLFLEADALSPSSALSFNIARAYEKIQDTKNALRWYRDYLRREPEAEDRRLVEDTIRAYELALSERGIQQISVISDPTGATLRVDGRPVGVTPWTGELAPGAHALSLALRGYADTTREVALEAERSLYVNVRLVPAPAAPPPAVASAIRAPGSLPAPPAPAEPARAGHAAAASSDTAAPSSARVRPLTYVLIGGGAAALGVATAFELSRRNAEDDAESERTQIGYARALDRVESRQTMARVFAGVGGAVLLTGAISLVIDLGRGREAVAVSGACRAADCVVTARGTF